MKNIKVLENILHFVVHNSILFTVAVIGLVHLILLGAMGFAGVTPLMLFNILSVIVYMFCVLLCRGGHFMPVYVSMLIEVTVYTIISVYYVGWDCDPYCFLFSIVPIIIYLGCFLFKGPKRWIIVLILILVFTVYVFLYFRFSGAEPVYELSNGVKSFLALFSSFAMVFATIFYSMIYINTSEFEMTNLEQRNERLSADAKEDALTGLLNRRGFLPLVKELMGGDEKHHFCIAFCDIDNFKRINDSYGHDCGDEVLRHISWMIKKEMHGCAICRWGGEEIIILMKDYDMVVARQKMEYIRRSIESTPTVFYNKRIAATITIGLEEINDTYEEPEDIIKVADERMYYGKQHGKNILIYEEMES